MFQLRQISIYWNEQLADSEFDLENVYHDEFNKICNSSVVPYVSEKTKYKQGYELRVRYAQSISFRSDTIIWAIPPNF